MHGANIFSHVNHKHGTGQRNARNHTYVLALMRLPEGTGNISV